MFKFLIVFLCLLSSNIVSAEITKNYNEFDNTKSIYSISNEADVRFPKLFIFRKNISPVGTSFFITIQNNNNVTKLFNSTEDIKLKINDNSLFTLPTRTTKLGYDKKQATAVLTPEIASQILSSEKIILQIPIILKQTSILGSYYYIEVPKSILDEWKQVITME